MKELSIFIDESGDFGEVKERPAYYLVVLILLKMVNSINCKQKTCVNRQN